MGLLAGVNAARLLQGEDGLTFSRRTAMGGLSQYISSGPNDHFQPMNINFGLMEPLGIKKRMKKKKRTPCWLSGALDEIEQMKGDYPCLN